MKGEVWIDRNEVIFRTMDGTLAEGKDAIEQLIGLLGDMGMTFQFGTPDNTPRIESHVEAEHAAHHETIHKHVHEDH